MCTLSRCRFRTYVLFVLATMWTWLGVASGQDAYPPDEQAAVADAPRAGGSSNGSEVLSPEELDDLLKPIALYPDVLIAQILPATTYPNDIVEAARFLTANSDLNALDRQDWDPSVKALARYPTVLQQLD